RLTLAVRAVLIDNIGQYGRFHQLRFIADGQERAERKGRAGKLRKLGIIGGTSWSSTALYYEHINRGIAQRLGGLHSAALSIESLDLAPFAEMELSGNWGGVAKVTLDAAKRLEAAGGDGVSST